MELISQPWPWYVAGPILAFVMFGLIYFGENFGMSNNLRTICSLGGASRFSDFFRIDTKKQFWNLSFVLGGMIGGYIAVHHFSSETILELSSNTVAALSGFGFSNVGDSFLPAEIFSFDQLSSFSGISILLGGGFLVGFGARYAGGCTSGHAISGLSNLQIPSLIAVVGFFIGGLVMVHLIMPFIF